MHITKKIVNTITVSKWMSRFELMNYFELTPEEALVYRESDNLMKMIKAYVYAFATTYNGKLITGKIKVNLLELDAAQKLNVEKLIRTYIKAEVKEKFMEYQEINLLKKVA